MKNDLVDMQLELDVSYISATELICSHLSLLKNPHKGENAHKICVRCRFISSKLLQTVRSVIRKKE